MATPFYSHGTYPVGQSKFATTLKSHAESAEVLDVHNVEVGHVAVGALLIVVVVL